MASEEATTAAISVGRMVFCRSIEEREPKDAAETFPTDVGRIYCFTAILNAGPEETHVVHKWYRGEELMAEVKLKAQGEYWRTWSVKGIMAEWTGRWRVDVVSAAGDVLKSASFVVGEAEPVEDADSEADGTDGQSQDEPPNDGEDHGDPEGGGPDEGSGEDAGC
ncbi:MAG: DUF2914 domain-containing protein [Verrucomicrobia bacterium]|nr:DUF2914 domain-containing protein [Verrucomicrobiota bacterium]